MPDERLEALTIKTLTIERFGCLRNRSLSLSEGVNIIEGANESGKSTLAAFLRFMLYGFRDKADREFCMPWLITGNSDVYTASDNPAVDSASGSLTFVLGKRQLRIERVCSPSGSEKVNVVDLADGSIISNAKAPGEELLGIPADIFTRTAFIGQRNAAARMVDDGAAIDGSALSTAIGNLLYSADETLNVDKALKRLDKESVELMHKDGGGGKIPTLMSELDTLKTELERASAENVLLMSAETSLQALWVKIEERRSEAAELKDEYERASAYLKLQSIKYRESIRVSAEHSSAELAELDRKYTYAGFTPDESYRNDLIRVSGELNRQDDSLRQIREELTGESIVLPELSADCQRLRDVGGSARILNDLDKMRSRLRRYSFGSVIIGISAILMLIVGALTIIGSPLSGGVVLFTGTMLAVVCAVLATYAAKSSSEIGRLFKSFGCENEEQLREKLDDLSRETDETERLRSAGVAARMRISFTKKARADRLEEADSLLKRWGRSSLAAAISELDEYLLRRAKLLLSVEHDKTVYSELAAISPASEPDSVQIEELSKILNNNSSDGDRKRVYTDEDQNKLRRSYEYTTAAIQKLEERCHILDNEITAIKASYVRPSDVSDRIYYIQTELDELKERHAALMLAQSKLGEAAKNLRESISPRLSQYAGRLMERVTGGHCAVLGVDSSMQLTFESGGMTREGSAMSSGTRDAAYISLRFALIDLLYLSARPPVIFDEAFARLDDKRLSGILGILNEFSNEGTQVIILTCHNREAKLMKTIGDVSVIRL